MPKKRDGLTADVPGDFVEGDTIDAPMFIGRDVQGPVISPAFPRVVTILKPAQINDKKFFPGTAVVDSQSELDTLRFMRVVED